MKNILKTLMLLAAVGCFTFLSACSGTGTKSAGTIGIPSQTVRDAKPQASGDVDLQSLMKSLDEIAELERAGNWLQGMALTESTFREQAGDFSGAVAAAYKELSLAYGRGMIGKQDVEQGLKSLLELDADKSVSDAANAILAFMRGEWEKASAQLSALFDLDEEPDSFANWMVLVCTMEKNRLQNTSDDKRTSSAYRSIRARYAQYPEYWYRGARAFSAAGSSIAAEYAENCINSSVQGPFADECRKILAEFNGIKNEDPAAIKTKREIDFIISQSVNSVNPQILESLLPLISLPDNPYTVYAIGALRNLTTAPIYRDYFSAQASISRGRLAERLLYISRS